MGQGDGETGRLGEYPRVALSPLPGVSAVSIEETQQGNGRIEKLAIALEELVGILDVELDQYRDLLRLLHSQREFFAVGDIGSFEEISKRQETAVLKIKTLEEARKSVVARLAQYLNIPPSDTSEFTLSKLAALVETSADALIRAYGERCAAYREEILSLIRELENLRENNSYLIQHALHHVTGVLKIFASAHITDCGYSRVGQIKQKAKTGKRVSGWG